MRRVLGPLAVVWTTTGILLLIALRTAPVRTFSLTPEDRPRVVRGLAVEGEDWTGPKTQLLLHGVDWPARVELRLRPNALLFENEGRIRILRGRTIVSEERVAKGKSLYSFTLEKGVTGGPWLAPEPLDLVCDQYIGRAMAHAVGVRLFEVRVEPRPQGIGHRTVWRALAATLVLSLLSLLLLRADRRFASPGPHGALRVVAPTAAAGMALVWVAWRDPYLLAWVAPPLPTASVLAALSLLLFGRRKMLARVPRSAVGSLGLLAGAQAAFHFWGSPLAGAVLTVLGLLLLPAGPFAPTLRGWSERGILLGAALVLAVALGLRLYRIEDIPFGMWRDEARHGQVALKILEDPGYRPLYVAQSEPKINLPGLGLHLLALGVAGGGTTVWSMRVVTALAGGITVLSVIALARRLFGAGPLSLFAGFFVAVSAWHLILSRYAFPTVFDPLLGVTGLWLSAIGMAARRHRVGYVCLFAGGMLCGLAAHTYHTGRLACVVGLVFLTLCPPRGRASLGRIAVWSAGALLVLLPLLGWAFRHPGRIAERVNEVSLLGRAPSLAEPPPAALDQSLWRHLLMFNVRGDLDVHHNLPGRPLLDPVTGLGFLAGLGVLIRRRDEAALQFLGVALVLGLLPSAFAINGPSGMRAIGAVVPVCLLAAVGLVTILAGLECPRGMKSALSAGLVCLALFFNVRLYFVDRPVRVWQGMYPVDAAMGTFVRSLADRGPAPRVFVPRPLTEEAVLPYLAHGVPLRTFEEATLSEPWMPGDWFLLPPGDSAALAALQEPLGRDPRPEALGPFFPGTQTPAFLAYRARLVRP